MTLWILFLELAAAPLSLSPTAQSAGPNTCNADWGLRYGSKVLLKIYRDSNVSEYLIRMPFNA